MYICRHEFHKSCIDPWLLEHRTCPMCKMDILKHYGFVVGAQNQIINLNDFIITAQASSNNELPHNSNTIQTTSTPTTINNQIHQNSSSTLTQTVAAHVIITANDNDTNNVLVDTERYPRDTMLSITQSQELLAISSASSSQPINISNSIIHNNDNSHLEVDIRCSNCSGNCCNRCKSDNCICDKLSSANYSDTDNNTQSSNSNCLLQCSSNNARNCMFSSFIDSPDSNTSANSCLNKYRNNNKFNSSIPAIEQENDSNNSRRVSDI